jgi:hypothetical protein
MTLCGQRALSPTDALPPSLLRDIFLRLPADQRARCAVVSVGWRAAVADPALWRRLDLSAASGVTCRVDAAAVRAATARARGGLESLDITGPDEISDALLEVAAGNAASLRELRLACCLSARQLQALLAAAPAMTVLQADAISTCTNVRSLLRAKPVQLRELTIRYNPREDMGEAFPVAELIAHTSLTDLVLICFDQASLTPDELYLLFDSALALRLSSVHCCDFLLSPAAVPALTRLLRSAELKGLHLICVIEDVGAALLDAPAAGLLANALRANCTLQNLTLENLALFEDAQVAATLLGALTGHASLRSLDCKFNVTFHGVLEATTAAIGGVLGALVAADAPALEELDVRYCSLGDAVLGPLCDALAHNNHLRKLALQGNNMSAACAAQRLLPAVRANASLRKLEALGMTDDGIVEDDEHKAAAVQLVTAREAARLAAEAAAAAGAA